MSGDGAAESPLELPEGVTKEILQQAPDGETLRPQTDDECEVQYIGRLASTGEEFDSSEDHEGGKVTFRLGCAGAIRGWEPALRSMRRGEVSKFSFAPEHAYGSAGHPPRIPGNATLVFEVTLVGWRSFADLFGDGTVTRTKVKEGLSVQAPVMGSEVLCSLKVSALDGHVLDDNPTLEYVVGSGKMDVLSRAVDRAVLDMRKGGVVRLECSKAYLGDVAPEPVVVELKLHNIFDIDDMSPNQDRSILKKVAVAGKGSERPLDGAAVRLIVEGAFFVSGEALPGFKGRTKMRFTLGHGEVCDALEYATLGMLPHEHALVTCSRPALCADPKLGLEALAKREGEVQLMVALENFDPAKPSSDMSAEERLAFASEQKNVGGSLFKGQRYALALRRYGCVVELFSAKSDDQNDENRKLRNVCELNRAACMLKLGDNRSASSSCTAVLVDEPGNIKALFRRASARIALGDYLEAVSDLRDLLKRDPDNKDAVRLLQQAQQSAKDHSKKSKETYGKMCQALDGKDAAEQARKLEEARHIKKPGQTLSIAEQENYWELAMEDAKKTLAEVISARDGSGGAATPAAGGDPVVAAAA